MPSPQSPVLPNSVPLASVPDREAALSLYRQRAHRYDAELALFEPLRRQAVALLDLKPGETVLDLGCGTGLSLPLLAQAVGPSGHVIGLEQCPEMMGAARERVAAEGWPQVSLQQQPVEAAQWLPGERADAALFHFTHDILQRPEAIAAVLAQLKPGARVVACGLQWAPAWAWAANWWVLSAALYSVTTLSNLHKPWDLLKAALPALEVQPLWMGSVYLGKACLPVAPNVEVAGEEAVGDVPAVAATSEAPAKPARPPATKRAAVRSRQARPEAASDETASNEAASPQPLSAKPARAKGKAATGRAAVSP